MPRTPQELSADFADAVRAQDRCILAGDARRGDEHAAIYVKSAETLRSAGPAYLDALAALLRHSDASVRVMAAAFLLRDRTDDAVAALRGISESDGLAHLGAKSTLDRYDRGILDIRSEA
jgi:hypothetical protein